MRHLLPGRRFRIDQSRNAYCRGLARTKQSGKCPCALFYNFLWKSCSDFHFEIELGGHSDHAAA